MTVDSLYDEIADSYEAAVGDVDSDTVAQELLRLVGCIEDLHVLDLACGQGRITRELAHRGARTVGTDISDGMLEKARMAEDSNPLGIDYYCADARAQEELQDHSFDAVTCNFGLSDIAELDATLKEVARVLKPHGVFVFSILHPCFPGFGADAPSAWPPDRGYYREGWWLAHNTGFRGKVGSHFRMASTYINALIRHGFVIDRVAEPEPPLEFNDRHPELVPVPYALVVRSRLI